MGLIELFVGLATLIWLAVFFCSAYLWFIALASVPPIRRPKSAARYARFAIAIPAHDEESVIADTVTRLLRQDYPRSLFEIFVVADNCSDRTAEIARSQGALCYERKTDQRVGKGAALSWLFERIFHNGTYEAIVVFDADTHVQEDFLKTMNERLQGGAQVIQGRHVIATRMLAGFQRCPGR